MSETAAVYQFKASHLWREAQWRDATFGVDSEGRLVAATGE